MGRSSEERVVLLSLAWLPTHERVIASRCSKGVWREFSRTLLVDSEGTLDLVEAGDRVNDGVLGGMGRGEGEGGRITPPRVRALRLASRSVSGAGLERFLRGMGRSLQALELVGCEGVCERDLARTLLSVCLPGEFRRLELSVVKSKPAVPLSEEHHAARGIGLFSIDNFRPQLPGSLSWAHLYEVICKLGVGLISLRLLGVGDASHHESMATILSCCPHLVELSLGHFFISPWSEPPSLSAGMGRIRDEAFRELQWPGTMRRLSLRGLRGYSARLIPCATPLLTALDISGMQSVDDDVVATLAKLLPHLLELDLSCCVRVTSQGAMAIGRYSPQLEAISLHSCHVCDVGVCRLLAGCRRLTKINLSLTYIKDRTITALEGSPKLRHVNVRCCKLLLTSPLKPIARLREVKRKVGCVVWGGETFQPGATGFMDIPRELSLNKLVSWKGFNGCPADAVRDAILKLKPLAKSTLVFGPRDSDKYPRVMLRHQALFGLSREEGECSPVLLVVDVEGCAIASKHSLGRERERL